MAPKLIAMLMLRLLVVLTLAARADSLAIPFMGLDIPKELIMDVNKGPFPRVNIVADAPPSAGPAADSLRAERRTELLRAKAAFAELLSYKRLAAQELRKENALQKKLAQFSAAVKHSLAGA